MSLSIALSPTLVERYPEFRAAFLLAPVGAYATPAEADAGARRVFERALAEHGSADALRASGADTCYREFYRSMGLKAAQVSNPVKQAARVLEAGAYRSVFKPVDVAMEIEYSLLVSFQLYAAGAVDDALTYDLATGDEPIVTTRHEDKTAKPGELVLLNGDGTAIHTCYYGNHRDYMLDLHSGTALVRVMGVPGIDEERFVRAYEEAADRLGATAVLCLDAGSPAATSADQQAA